MIVETKAAFARRIDVKPPRVSVHVRNGLPLTPEGLVPVEAALRWIKERTNPVASDGQIRRRQESQQATKTVTDGTVSSPPNKPLPNEAFAK